MLRVASIIALAMLAACPGGDDGDDDADIDAMVPHGLVVRWAITPGVPGAVSADLSVSSVELGLSSLRVVGDAAPGDTRTTRDSVELRWNRETSAAPIEFPDAPAGLYARVELGAGGDSEHYDLHGRVVVGGDDLEFCIEDETPLSVSLPIDVEVTAGDPAQLTIVFDVVGVLAAVPFDQIPPERGEICIESGDPEMAAVRSAMASAFRVEP